MAQILGAGLRAFKFLIDPRFSRDEAQTIAAFVPVSLTLSALDFNASKKNVLNSDLSQFRVLHFATHGVLDTQRPERSGLALSFVSERGEFEGGTKEYGSGAWLLFAVLLGTLYPSRRVEVTSERGC